MKFTKMHGAGNDYVYVNCFEERMENPEQVAVKVSNRNFGIGSDGLILILPSVRADIRMRMFNADGSESEMCGNGIRCVAKYAFDHGLVTNREITAETGAGILTLQLFTDSRDKVETCSREYGGPAPFARRDTHDGERTLAGHSRAAQHSPYFIQNYLPLHG